MRFTHTHLELGLLLWACGLGGAMAQDTEQAVAAFGVPLPAQELDSYRGGFDVVSNSVQLSGTVTGNVASNLLTGNNVVTDGAFTNASGLPMVIQNSGSNVSIQNATVVNVQLQ